MCIVLYKALPRTTCLLLIPLTTHQFTRIKLKNNRTSQLFERSEHSADILETKSLNIYEYCHVHVKHWCYRVIKGWYLPLDTRAIEMGI